MVKSKSNLSLGQKVAIIMAIVSISAIGFPLLTLILFSILHKLIPNSGTIYTLAVVLPFTWAPVLGLIFGIILGLIIIFRNRS